ncbi:MAG TPA: RIP metalloprotease RseP [Balneola sp.]|jgi:regulator of sigma E protease|nr:RIP metalloprotease RseP [Balneola sp.]MAO78299.1 RIP metalloprotease RseP [Balneola sp.]MBF64300.1 RIP metalloprotease RseP [Balneola sp.]HAH51370.1 RIP metalloprotease RseP [Balneola sp.]|tara:strand:- start:352 stop:1683 length:1332 start_codon:yes stop_codon:yes gene_type:complete
MTFIEILSTIGIFMGALMILVFIHELGHFLAAKLFGMRVERFSVGFPPRVWGFKKGDTDYCIGATPLGGYVKISGMVDESMDNEFLEQEPQPWEYRSKPVWQRMVVITAGVIFNMILAFVIFSGMIMTNGKVVVPVENVDGIYVTEESILHEIGFRNNDKIIGVNGENVVYFNDLVSAAALTTENLNYQVIRNGEEITIPVASSFLDSIQTRGFITADLILPSSPSSIVSNSPASEAGLQRGDKIIGVNGEEVNYWIQLVSLIQANPEGEPMDVEVHRNGDLFEVQITPKDGAIGIYQPDLEIAGGIRIDYGFFESITAGWNETGEQTTGILQGFARMIKGDISVRQNLGGPIAIANMTKQATDNNGWIGFWTITALLSITLAIMNILPIPALDGGHLVFLIYEGITRKEPTEKVRIIAQNIGFFVLVTLMIFVVFNDVIKLF